MPYNYDGQYAYHQSNPNTNSYHQPDPDINSFRQPDPDINSFHQPDLNINSFHQPDPNINSYQQPPHFYQELQQYAAPQYHQPPFQRPQPPILPSSQPGSNIQVIIPARPPHQAQYQQHSYSYNQQFVPPPQPQYFPPPQQYLVNEHAAMPSSQPSPRPAREPHQDGHVPHPPPSQPSPRPAREPHPDGHVPRPPPSQPSPRSARELHQDAHVPHPPPASSRAESQQSAPPVAESDYPAILLALADEYFTAAAKLNDQSDTYFKLIATGLGCLESVLTNFKIPPLREAQLSLKYAQVLYDETENYDDAERVLTKAIDICERNKFLDLKYNLQLLLARILYQSKPRAAVKDLQTMLEETEAYNHTAWEYATRYQLAMFHLPATAVRDLHSAIHHIEKLESSSSTNGDKSIATFANVVCALLYLQTSGPDATSSSQQALAKARALSTNEEVSSIPQITLMMEFIDLCCSIRENNRGQGDEKRRRMHTVWTALEEKGGWVRDGRMLFLPINKSSLRGVQLQLGGLVWEARGRYILPFSWIEMNDAETWGYLLSAISKSHKNLSDPHRRAQKFIKSGLERARDPMVSEVTSPQQKTLECQFLIEHAFLQCQEGQWDEAQDAVDTISKISKELGEGLPHSMVSTIQYLNGAIQQGRGNLDAALQIYQSPMFDLSQFKRGPESSSLSHKSQDSESDMLRNIAILAALNKLLIVNDRSHTQYNQIPDIIERLKPLVKATQDKTIEAAYKLIRTNVVQLPIWEDKDARVQALNLAKAAENSQVAALVLVTMYLRYFCGLNNKNAHQCLKATRVNMKDWGSTTWLHVTAGLEAQALEFWGRSTDAQTRLEEARERLEGLPERVRVEVQK